MMDCAMILSKALKRKAVYQVFAKARPKAEEAELLTATPKQQGKPTLIHHVDFPAPATTTLASPESSHCSYQILPPRDIALTLWIGTAPDAALSHHYPHSPIGIDPATRHSQVSDATPWYAKDRIVPLVDFA
jgi:hypothetical protein